MEKPNKVGRGRPSKMTKEFIEIFEEIVSENILFLTDEEMIIELNDKLPKEQQIIESTFRKWKAGGQSNNVFYEDFLHLIKKALTKQKVRLFNELQSDEKAWQRWAWIIERKFDDWNIRYKTDVSSLDGSMSPTSPKTLADWYDKARSQRKDDAG